VAADQLRNKNDTPAVVIVVRGKSKKVVYAKARVHKRRKEQFVR